MIESPAKVPSRRKYYTPVQNLALSGDGAFDASDNVALIAPSFLGLEGGKNYRSVRGILRNMKIDFSIVSGHGTQVSDGSAFRQTPFSHRAIKYMEEKKVVAGPFTRALCVIGYCVQWGGSLLAGSLAGVAYGVYNVLLHVRMAFCGVGGGFASVFGNTLCQGCPQVPSWLGVQELPLRQAASDANSCAWVQHTRGSDYDKCRGNNNNKACIASVPDCKVISGVAMLCYEVRTIIRKLVQTKPPGAVMAADNGVCIHFRSTGRMTESLPPTPLLVSAVVVLPLDASVVSAFEQATQEYVTPTLILCDSRANSSDPPEHGSANQKPGLPYNALNSDYSSRIATCIEEHAAQHEGGQRHREGLGGLQARAEAVLAQNLAHLSGAGEEPGCCRGCTPCHLLGRHLRDTAAAVHQQDGQSKQVLLAELSWSHNTPTQLPHDNPDTTTLERYSTGQLARSQLSDMQLTENQLSNTSPDRHAAIRQASYRTVSDLTVSEQTGR
ncbi:hypothetical protein PR048_024037 [Dryococelus australis]|uniref:Uncharacterized protein n=1 Tax=Dryococelus australis TaxID=614101 RepID=A0ABQ9GVU6_9NEOP|nr:hypothetical protein PR048_024037 [Dryococelus australis]